MISLRHTFSASLAFSIPFAIASAQDDTRPPQSPQTAKEPSSEGRGLKRNDAGAFQGYTLFSPLQSATTYLIDMNGAVVHSWKTSHGPGNSDHLLDNGHLLRSARMDDGEVFHGGGIGGRLQEFDWDGTLLWDYVIASDHRHAHHDFEVLPNGNVLAIVWEKKTRDEAVALGRDSTQVRDAGWWPDAIVELEPQRPSGARVVWEWRSWDHLIQDRDPKKPGYGSIPDHPELIDVNADHRHDVPLTEAQKREKAERDAKMRASGYAGGDEDDEPVPPPSARGERGARDDRDSPGRAGGAGGPDGRGGRGGPGGGRGPRDEGDWLHTNAVDYDAAHDLILLSSPRLNEIFVIDHSTTTEQAASHAGGKRGKGGDLLWRFGNPRNYGAGTDADRKLFAQHDARFVRAGLPGAGHVTVFNNGQGRPKAEYSSVDELELPFDAEKGFVREGGKPFGPASVLWSYSSPSDFYSFFISGAHRLPNGNTLVCEGASGRFFEVTNDQRIVWEYLNPFGGDLERGPRGGAGGAPDFGPDGGPPDGASPPDRSGARDGDRGGRGRGPGMRGGPGGGPQRLAVFRATRIALDHPGLKGRELKSKQ